MDNPSSDSAPQAVFTYRPAGVEGLGCFAAAMFAALINALSLFKGYMNTWLSIIVTVLVNLVFAAASGLVYCLVDEVKIGEDKIFETLYWQHPRSGARRVLKQYEFWRSDYDSIRLHHGRGFSTISLHSKKEESITLDRIFASRHDAETKAKQIAEQLELPLLTS